jgi:uncharacterized phage infection (PIP) family protein YhgE
MESNFEMQERYSQMLRDNFKNLRSSWQSNPEHQTRLQQRQKQLDERLPQLRQGRSKIQRASKIAEQIRQDLENLFPSEKPYISQPQQKQLRENRQVQQQLREQAQQLQDKMQRMGQRLPMFSPQMQQLMREANEQMGEAKDRLGQREPRPAQHAQERASSKLQQLRKQMQQAMKQQGSGSKKQDPVEIPDASKHKAPKALRQDIMDAMKEKVPKPYREPAQRYYEKLIK